MITRRRFLFGGAAALGLGVAVAAGQQQLVPDLLSNSATSPNSDRVLQALETTIGERFDQEQVSEFVAYLDNEQAWLWGDGVTGDVIDRTICTQFIMTSSLALNGMDTGDYQFFDGEIICSPFARLD